MVPLSTGITSYPFSRLPINMDDAQMSTWDAVTCFHSSLQKSKRPHPGTQILSQIPEVGEGNRGQMFQIYPWSPPSPPQLRLNKDQVTNSNNSFISPNSSTQALLFGQPLTSWHTCNTGITWSVKTERGQDHYISHAQTVLMDGYVTSKSNFDSFQALGRVRLPVGQHDISHRVLSRMAELAQCTNRSHSTE